MAVPGPPNTDPDAEFSVPCLDGCHGAAHHGSCAAKLALTGGIVNHYAHDATHKSELIRAIREVEDKISHEEF